MSEEMINYGFFSEKQSEVTGKIFVYELQSGKQVHVTEVTTNNRNLKSNFEDMIYVGQLKKKSYVETINCSIKEF